MQSPKTNTHKRHPRISGLIFRMSGVIFLIAGILIVVFVNFHMRQHALDTAEQKARIILDRNYATHTYFSKHLKPAVFEVTEPVTPSSYFDPAWMSSTYAVRQIDKYFQSMNPAAYYYKECAINARSSENEADAYERAFLETVNAGNSSVIKKAGIRELNGKPFYTVLRRAETMEKSCLRCHGDPEDAPADMLDIYGPERSFNREVGEVVSAVSIRIPLTSAYASANRLSIELSGFLILSLLLIFGVQYLMHRRFIFSPLSAVQAQAQEITQNEASLGKEIDPPKSRELWELTTTFNHMSRHLRYHVDNLDNMVKERTRALSETNEQLANETEAHKKVQNALAAEKEWFFTILHSIGDGVITTDTSGKIVLMNRMAENLTGWKSADAIGQPLDQVFKIINELTREPAGNPVEKVLATGQIVGLANHTVLISRDGLEIPIKDSGAPVVMKNGENIGVVLVFQDNATARIAEQEIRESEERYRLLAENTVDCIWTMNLDTVFTYINPAIEALTGYTPEEWIGTCLADHCDEKNLKKMTTAIQHAMAALPETAHTRFEVQIQDREGRPVDVEITGRVLMDEQKHPIAMQGVTRDITDRKKLEAMLLQSHKIESIGTLAGGIAHDFNNILSSILGYTELVLDDLEKGSMMESNLQEVYKAGIRARDLVKQILTFARQAHEETKPLQVSTIAKEALKLLRSTIPVTIEIRQNIKSNALIDGTPSQIHQIFMNLCTNAAQAMEKTGGILEVGLREVAVDESFKSKPFDLAPGNYLEITVSDTGPGILPQIIDSIFEPYFTTKAPGEGTGMGLSTVHGIVKQHHGEIFAENRAENGAVFTVYLPVTQKTDKTAVFQSEVAPGGTERILLVDDEPPIANMGRQALEGLGYTMTTRTSSIDALALFQAKPEAFDLVILDMTMPKMTGDVLAAEMMKIRPDIPIILCTGYSRTISEGAAGAIGIRAFVYKPLVRVDLAKTVRKVLDEMV